MSISYDGYCQCIFETKSRQAVCCLLKGHHKVKMHHLVTKLNFLCFTIMFFTYMLLQRTIVISQHVDIDSDFIVQLNGRLFKSN